MVSETELTKTVRKSKLISSRLDKMAQGSPAPSSALRNTLIILGIIMILVGYGMTGYLLYRRMESLQKEIVHLRTPPTITIESEPEKISDTEPEPEPESEPDSKLSELVHEPAPCDPEPEPISETLETIEEIIPVVVEPKTTMDVKRKNKRVAKKITLEPIEEVVHVDVGGGSDTLVPSDDL